MKVTDYLKTKGALILDGAMGSLLSERGLRIGERPEEWAIKNPDEIGRVHTEYFTAGADAVLTDTFGANVFKYDEAAVEEMIAAAVALAKKARDGFNDGKIRFIGLDVGPSGRMLAPFGDLPFEEAINGFKKSIEAGARAGVDFIFIETFTDLAETKAAVLAAKETTNLPIFVSNAYGEDGTLFSGASARAVAATLTGLKVDAIGCNCSFGPKDLFGVLKELLSATDLPVIFKPNAGMPKVVGDKTVYDVSPEEFGKFCVKARKAGASVIGGCCGTTPAFIEKLPALCHIPVRKRTAAKTAVISSQIKAVEIGAGALTVGERINPTGRKDLKEALLRGDGAYIIEQAVEQIKCGADILDVNVGLPVLDESAVLTKTISDLCYATDVPLCIDTSSEKALGSALRAYIGKPLVNSVNGSEESINTVFPLVKKYGGVTVCLLLDEKGIPATAKERFVIAEKIIAAAKTYGIDKNDLVFDALTMTVGADPTAARVTLDTLKLLNRAGLKTILGVSNVSFGLPKRDEITAAFLTMALSIGLDLAIVDPVKPEIKRSLVTYHAINGKDTAFKNYSAFVSGISDVQAKVNEGDVGADDLKQAITDGLKDKAVRICENIAEKKGALEIINGEIMPALDKLGKGFEEKAVSLPQLLLSAECAKAAFDVVKKRFSSESGIKKQLKTVIATVKGDVHDIGKNIVKLLLENYGFTVVDLGKDVSPEAVLDAVKKERADLLGLSALMTTTVSNMKKTVELIKKNAPQCKIMVGGAVLTEEYAAAIGADYYAKDATASVKIAEMLERAKKG